MTEGGAPQRSESDGDRDKTYLSTGDEGTRTRTDGSDNQWYCDKKTNSRPQPVSSSNASWNVVPCKKTNRSISPKKKKPRIPQATTPPNEMRAAAVDDPPPAWSPPQLRGSQHPPGKRRTQSAGQRRR